jgi:regulator of protease activity HflC (stomatin/prohibitin superfamily)
MTTKEVVVDVEDVQAKNKTTTTGRRNKPTGDENEIGAAACGGCCVISFVIALTIVLALAITIVPAGHVGVVDRFGRVSDEHLTSGVGFVNPAAKVVKMSTRTQVVPYDKSVLSSEGLTIDIILSLQFSIEPSKAVTLYKTVGENYKDVIVVPTLSSIIREVTSKRDAKAMYTSQTRMEMHKELKTAVSDALSPKGIVVEDVLLRDVRLPDKLKAAIESKLDMEQQAERMKFVLQKEQQEAERKKTEAIGIQTFQKIVSEGINQDLLEWKGIEATERLSESSNTKIVFIGRSGDGLPLMFDPSTKS